MSTGNYERSFHDGNDLVCATNVTLEHISTIVICDIVVSGRFVTLSSKGKAGQMLMVVCEIEIYGSGKLTESEDYISEIGLCLLTKICYTDL